MGLGFQLLNEVVLNFNFVVKIFDVELFILELAFECDQLCLALG